MKRGTHKKPESQFVQGTCIVCNKNKQQSSGSCDKGKNKGKKIYKNTCTSCSLKKNIVRTNKVRLRNKTRMKLRKYPWAEHKKDYCENCGFIALHSCQLDIDHIDGNHNNNDSSNYKTLCANCHRLKTYICKDWESKK